MSLFDSGASISCINQHVIKKLFKNPNYESATIPHVYGVSDEIHSVIGTLTLSFLLDGYPFEHTFHIFPNLHEPVILERDFMTKGLQLNFHSNTISLSKPNSETINISLISQEHSKTDFGKTFNSHVIPPHCEYILPLKTNKFKDGDIVFCCFLN